MIMMQLQRSKQLLGLGETFDYLQDFDFPDKTKGSESFIISFVHVRLFIIHFSDDPEH